MLAIGAVKTTGPVGKTLVEPPLGSTLTAGPWADCKAASIAEVSGALASPEADNRPMEIG